MGHFKICLQRVKRAGVPYRTYRQKTVGCSFMPTGSSMRNCDGLLSVPQRSQLLARPASRCHRRAYVSPMLLCFLLNVALSFDHG